MRIRTNTGTPCPIFTIAVKRYNTNYTLPFESSAAADYYRPWAIPNGYKTYEERIEDEVSVDGGFNDCLHTIKTNAFNDPWCRVFTTGACSSNWLLDPVGTTHINGCASAATSLPTWDTVDFGREALKKMLPRVNRGISLINFIYELKEFKSMAKHGWSLSGAIDRIRGRTPTKRAWGRGGFTRRVPKPNQASYSDMKYRMKGGRAAVVKDIARRLSGAHLETSFGWLPFFGDIAKIFTTLSRVDEIITKLKKYAGSPQQRHYEELLPVNAGYPEDREWAPVGSILTSRFTRPLEYSPYGSGQPNGSSDMPAATIRYWMRYVQRPIYHATLRYSYTLPDLDKLQNKVWFYLDLLGIRWDPQILWNAIPFSFLVDWVVNVGDFLGSFAKDNLDIQTTILDFCHSVKYRVEYRVQVSWNTGGGNFGVLSGPYWRGGPTSVGVFPADKVISDIVYEGTSQYYKRTTDMPSTRALTLNSPGLREGLLAGSLIIQKATQTKKGRR